MAQTDVFAGREPASEGGPAPDLSVVVTLFDEAGTIEELYHRTVAALEVLGRPWELIFVDDGSGDGTFAVLERLHAADPRIHAVRFKRNFGQHPAMHAGLARARGEIVITMDGDLQNQPEDIPRLVEAVAHGLERTGRIVTAAALLFCVAIGTFATSRIVFIKELALGMGAAVALDATIVRALLVPSLMALLGRWNWWAPRPLRRLHARLGLGESEMVALVRRDQA